MTLPISTLVLNQSPIVRPKWIASKKTLCGSAVRSDVDIVAAAKPEYGVTTSLLDVGAGGTGAHARFIHLCRVRIIVRVSFAAPCDVISLYGRVLGVSNHGTAEELLVGACFAKLDTDL